MSEQATEALIETLAAEARPVRVLAPPLKRALALLGLAAVAGAAAIMLMGDMDGLADRYAGRESMMWLEMAAMLTTGLIAVTGAFFMAVPGRSRRWLLAPLPPLLIWIALSGMGCWRVLEQDGVGDLAFGHGMDCLVFILGTSLAVGPILVWRLSRARPIEPLPVALLAGLGTASLSAFLLSFFHPFAVTFVDLGVHLVAVALVVGALAALNRRALAPA